MGAVWYVDGPSTSGSERKEVSTTTIDSLDQYWEDDRGLRLDDLGV